MMRRLCVAVFLLAFTFNCFAGGNPMTDKTVLEEAVFAGGCFWCLESDFDKLGGVVETISGYAGGTKENPTYEEVSSGTTKHKEVLLVKFNPRKVSYKKLLDYFWKHINPTDDGGQFVDRGNQYTSAIFYFNESQKKSALESKSQLVNSGKFSKPIVTEILPIAKFYPAEDYHQNYHKKSSLRYKIYRFASGRDAFLRQTWKTNEKIQKKQKDDKSFLMPSDEELKKTLTPLQYKVTQQGGTEPPLENEYNDNKREGIYVDIVSGEVLFSSTDKYDSGSGWPSFTKPIEKDNIVLKKDYKLFVRRTEVKSKKADSHLGHLFNDGPKEKGGFRYCVNSAALRFIPKENLVKEGYGEYLKLFKNP